MTSSIERQFFLFLRMTGSGEKAGLKHFLFVATGLGFFFLNKVTGF